ncbi:MAG: ornithine carbamoyltransferase [Synergistaceae bacterium]|nr:ornithine carbamoyltransferase [Synergistota bacterium]NLM71654.1 ornithine carbamoyltransferase [Synergistaceae bacterium]
MAFNLKGRSFLTLMDFTPEEIYYLLDLSADLKAKKRSGVRGRALQGKNIALIFEKSSTRTRCAFTVACIDEGGHPEFLGKNDIHLGGKEDVRDTARVLGRMFDGIQYRGFAQSLVEDLAKYAGIPVWNGLTDDDHPTQILADFLTIQENFGKQLKGIRLVYCGDGRNNMSNALMIGCAKLGMHYVVASPKSLFPEKGLLDTCTEMAERNGGSVTVFEDPLQAMKGADVIYTDVWVSMGEEAKAEERLRLLTPYQVNMNLVKASGKDSTIFLHCLPANKGQEVTEEVFESPNSKVFDEAENRMHSIKAIMVATIGNQ